MLGCYSLRPASYVLNLLHSFGIYVTPCSHYSPNWVQRGMAQNRLQCELIKPCRVRPTVRYCNNSWAGLGRSMLGYNVKAFWACQPQVNNNKWLSNIILLYFIDNHNAKQKHPGCKKVRGQSEAALQIGMCDQKL